MQRLFHGTDTNAFTDPNDAQARSLPTLLKLTYMDDFVDTVEQRSRCVLSPIVLYDLKLVDQVAFLGRL